MIKVGDIERTVSVKTSHHIDSLLKAALPVNLNIKYFAYIKLFHDGTRICLSNISNWTTVFYTEYFKLGMTSKSLDTYTTGFLLCSALNEQDICAIMREQFNIDHGILVIDKQATTCEISLFASTRENYTTINFYLNNLDVLKHFIYHFKDKCYDLIQQANTDRHILPRYFQENNLSTINFAHYSSLRHFQETYKLFRENTPVNRYYLKDTTNNTYLTQKELDCILCLIQGKSAKETANQLHITAKTVEAHLANTRQKLNVSNKSALIAKLINHHFVDIKII